MRRDKIYFIIISIFSILIIVLIMLNLLNIEKDSYICKKNISLNEIVYENKLIFDVGKKGEVLNLKEENRYVKLTDKKYKTLMDTVYINRDGTLTNFECEDQYTKYKKVTCYRNLDFYKIDDYSNISFRNNQYFTCICCNTS